jgi:6-phosphofructokinase 1
MGVHAVESIIDGKTNMMVGLMHEKMTLYPLQDAIKGKSKISKDLIRVSDILTI